MHLLHYNIELNTSLVEYAFPSAFFCIKQWKCTPMHMYVSPFVLCLEKKSKNSSRGIVSVEKKENLCGGHRVHCYLYGAAINYLWKLRFRSIHHHLQSVHYWIYLILSKGHQDAIGKILKKYHVLFYWLSLTVYTYLEKLLSGIFFIFPQNFLPII